MKRLRLMIGIIGVVAISAGCGDDNNFTPAKTISPNTVDGEVFGRGIGSLSDQPNPGRLQYPDIIHRTFIPEYDWWDHTRCQAWRIEWPVYGGSVSTDDIPTAFSTKNGALNSFTYLNNVDPATTHNAQFSIHYEQKLQNIGAMWAELDHADASLNDYVRFLKKDYPLETIMYMVTERPSLFQDYWEASDDIEVDYNAGDFFLWKNEDEGIYGGIRIVSVSPRIIEVYRAEPNL